MIDFFMPLLATLLILLMATVFYFRFDFLQPSVIVVGMMTLSTFLSIIMSEAWHLSMSFEGFFLITASMLAFVGGGIFANRCCDKTIENVVVRHRYKIEVWKILPIVLFMLWMAFLNLQSIYELSIEYGNKDGYFNMLRTLRPFIERNELVFDRWINYRNQIAQLMAYAFFYLFAFNVIFSKFRSSDLILLLPVACYIPFQVLSTGRLGMFFFAAYIIVVTLILYQKKNRFVLSSRLNAMKYLLFGGLTFIAIFFLMGTLTGKTLSSERTPLIILSHYIGITVPAFDALIHQPWNESIYIGANTLQGVYRVLRHIFDDLPTVMLFFPFVSFYHIDTNAYTMLGRYFIDYGRLGMIMICWILGAGYSFFYAFVKLRAENFSMPVMLYGYFCYPLFLSSLNERFLMDFASTTPVYTVLLLLIYRAIFFRKVER